MQIPFKIKKRQRVTSARPIDSQSLPIFRSVIRDLTVFCDIKMKMCPLKFCLLLPYIITLASCQSVYIPNAHNAPLFTKKGEFQGAAAIGISGLDVQTAVSLTNHIALMGNLAVNNGALFGSNSSSFNSSDSTVFYEGGLGYYKNYQKTCFEIFAGYGSGYGRAQADYHYGNFRNNGMMRGSYDRLFIQPSFGWNKRNFNLILTCRISRVDFKKFNMFGTLTDVSPSFYLEPAATARINFLDNKFYCFGQLGRTLSLESSEVNYRNDPHSYYRPVTLCFGLGFRLGGLRKEDAD